MAPSRVSEAWKILASQNAKANASNDALPSQDSGSSASKRKRTNLPPPQLDPLGLLSQPTDADGQQKRQKTMPGVFPFPQFDLTQTIENGPSSSQSGYLGDSHPGMDDGDDSDAEVALRGRLPTLTIEAQIEVMRDKLDVAGEDEKVLDIDSGGPNQEQELARFFAEQQQNFGKLENVKEALEKLGLEEVGDMIPGLDVRLLPHQVLGVSWMLAKEQNKRERGGILADDMGLGKTVQALALMVVNPPDLEAEDQREERRKQTLVIAPAALLDQWRDEFETKANMFQVFIHHGSQKAKDAKALRKYDVIITSYTTMLYDVEPRKNRDSRGPISSTKWYRIILDEAQIIRNRVAQTSIAAAKLDATYRWLLSGTPFTNGLADLYPLLRFSKLRPWNDWDTFKERIVKEVKNDPNIAAGRMNLIVKKHLLRRTKQDKLDGRPILELKPKHIDVEYVDFTPEEQRIYNAVEKRQQLTITRFMKRGTLLKNYQYVLIMILRMRQVCCHPQLIAYAANEIADPNAEAVIGLPDMGADGDDDDPADKNDLKVAEKVMGAVMINKLRATAKDRAKAAITRAIMPSKLRDDDDESRYDNECPICTDFFTSPYITTCGHMFCRDCIDGVLNRQIDYQNDDGGPGNRPCPSCRQPIRADRLFSAALFEPSTGEMDAMKNDAEREKHRKKKSSKLGFDIHLDDDSDADALPDLDDFWSGKKAGKSSKKKPSKKKNKTKEKKVQRLEDDSDEEIIDLTGDDVIMSSPGRPPKKSTKGKGKATRINSSSDESEDDDDDSAEEEEADPFRAAMLDKLKDFENSAKMTGMINLLTLWKEETPGDKVVVYSQWTSCMDLLEAALERENMRSLRYDGKMSREERSEVVRKFKTASGPNVLLVSLKCGGVGLNLVEANRVICFDPAWNFATESQAYDRVHRIGQQKEVFVKRMVVRDSIEDKILKIQQGKDDLTKAAMGEGSGVPLRKLRKEDILSLFNMH